MELKISVVTPVFNAAAFINRCVESCVKYPEVYEVLLIDDGSTDDSLSECRRLSQKYEKVKVLQHSDKANHGSAATRNIGLQVAEGEYIAFLDADDWYLPNRFEFEKKIFVEHPDAEGVYGCLGADFLTNEARERYSDKYPLVTLKRRIPPEELFEAMSPIGGEGYFSGCALSVKRTVFEKVGFFDPRLRMAEDTQLWVKMAALCRLYPGSILNPVAIRGVHSDNQTRDLKSFRSNQQYLYFSLLTWAINSDIAFSRLVILFRSLLNLVFDDFSKVKRFKRSIYLFMLLKVDQSIILKKRFWKLFLKSYFSALFSK